jgi:hypothetical protein
LWAQNRSTAEIAGAVTDPSGAVLVGVNITVTNAATGITTKVTTNAAGAYSVPFLQPGRYVLTFEAPNFKKLVRSGIELGLDQVGRIDARMELGATSQSVTVEENAPLVDVESSERGTDFNSELVADLPLVGRNPSSLAVLAPGTSTVQASIAGADPGRVNVNGNRAFSMSATINGGSVVLPNSVNFSSFIPGLSAVNQFRVIQDNFSAEFESGTSVLNIVLRSGTNQFHGSLFEFFQNDALNSRYFFAQSKTPLRYNQFGGSIGGPVKKDRGFFFFSVQDTLSPNYTVTFDTVPTQAVRNGDFSSGFPAVLDPAAGTQFPGNQIPAARVDPAAKAVQQYWPAANRPGLVNNFYFAAAHKPRAPLYNAKGDYRISSTNQVSGAFHYLNSHTEHSGSIPGPACYNRSERCGLQISQNQKYQLNDTWTASPAAVNEVRISFVRQFFNQYTPNQDQDFPSKLGVNNVPAYYFPYFVIQGNIPTSIGPGQHSGGTQNVLNAADDYSWTKGNHSLKFGAMVTKYQYNPLASWDSGTFTFSGLFAGNRSSNGYADFLLGLPQTYSLNAQPNTLGARRAAAAGFVQDAYHVRRNLTLNLGLRYEFQGAFSEAHNRLAGFDPSISNPVTNTPGALLFVNSDHRTLQQNHQKLFAPRVGLAWSLRPDLVVRSAYGIFYVPVSAQQNFAGAPPGYAIQQTLTTTNLQTPIFKLSQGPPPYVFPNPANLNGAVLNGQSVTWWSNDARQAYVQQWQFSIQKQLGKNSRLEAAYVGNRGNHLLFPRDRNQVPPDLLGPGNAQTKRPYTQFQGIRTLYNDAVSSYNALQISAKRNFYSGLTFLANYTWSKSMDNSSLDLTSGIGNEYQIASNTRLNWAPSQFDLRHRLVGAMVYDLPFGQSRRLLNRRGILDGIAGGWRASWTFTANSGPPFTVLLGGPNLTNALAGNVFPNRLRDGSLPGGQRSTSRWFDPTAFADPPAYTFGNSGRNILRGPGAWGLDFGLRKDFAIANPFKEGVRLQVRLDSFNILNHANMGLPFANTDSPATGTITSASSPRALQVGLQLLF